MDLLLTQDDTQVPFAGRDVPSTLSPALQGSPGWPIGGVPGISSPTEFPAYHYSLVMGELYNLLLATGTPPSDTNYTGIYQSILALARMVDTGSVNALAAAPANALLTGLPALATLPDGLTVKVIPANSTTGSAPTFNFAGLGAATIERPNGAPLQPSDIVAGLPVELMKAGGGSPVWWLLRRAQSDLRAAHGECLLTRASATQIALSPKNGCNIISGGVQYQLPAAGVTAANTNVWVNNTANQNLAASTVYLVSYNGSLGVLKFWALSTYGHNPDATAGNVGTEIIFNGATPLTAETLVGMIITNSSSQFPANGSSNGINLINWFNRALQVAASPPTLSVSTGASGPTELTTSARAPVLVWSGAEVTISCNGYSSGNGAGVTTTTGVGTVAGGTYLGDQIVNTSGASGYSINASHQLSSPFGEGQIIGTVFGGQNGGSGTWSFGCQTSVLG